VDGPMAEYQRNKTKSIQTDKAKPDRRKVGEDGALAAHVEEPASLRDSGQTEGQRADQWCLGFD